MACTFHARINHVWSIWYTISMVLLQVYLLYLGFERHKLYSEMKWPNGVYPMVWLEVYMILLSSCLPTLVLFFTFGVFKSGNIAGDNDRLGSRADRIIEISRKPNGRSKGGCLNCVKSMWQHSPPLPQSIHLFMALIHLVAQQLMLAQIYRYGFINSGDFLNTELDFVYQRARQLASNLPMLDSRLQGFRISAHDLSDAPIGPHLLPVLMHAKLFGIPLEFINLLLALFAYACAYSSVFWRVHKSFSLLFSFYLLIHIITVMWSYLGFSILYRIQETNYANERPVGLGQYLSSAKPLKVFHPLTILGSFIASIVLIHIAPIALYAYGYSKFYINLMNIRCKISSRSQVCSTNGPQSEYSECRRRGTPRASSAKLCCDGYGPHIIAILLLVVIVIVKVPSIYAFMVLYQHEEKPILLSCIVVDVGYLFTWIAVWLILTLKRDWKFKAIYKTHEIIALQSGHRTMNNIQLSSKGTTDAKNALIFLHDEQMYITDDTCVKQNILRLAQKGFANFADEVYWLRVNGANSPSMRKIPLTEIEKDAAEVNRLLGASVMQHDENCSPNAGYHSITRSNTSVGIRTPPRHQACLMRADHIVDPITSNEVGMCNTFGTLQRNQRSEYATTLNRYQTQIQRKPSTQCDLNTSNFGCEHSCQAMPIEAYASINKSTYRPVNHQVDATPGSIVGSFKHDLTNLSLYSTVPACNKNYATYARVPQQTRNIQYHASNQRLGALPSAAQQNGNDGNIYGNQQSSNCSHFQCESTPTMNAVRRSPVASERQFCCSATSREASPYQRAPNIKLSSFASNPNGSDSLKLIKTTTNTPSAAAGWMQQRNLQQNDPSPAHWVSNPSYKSVTATSVETSQQIENGACFSPTPTLISQDDATNYSTQQMPIASSPNSAPSFGHVGTSGTNVDSLETNNLYGTIDEEISTGESNLRETPDRERTLRAKSQKPFRELLSSGKSVPIRHQVRAINDQKRDGLTNNYNRTTNSEMEAEPQICDNNQSRINQSTTDFATSIV